MRHKRPLMGVGIVLVLTLALEVASVAGVWAASPKTLYLDWRQVVPAGSGNPNTFGEATVSANAGQGRLCYSLRVFVYPGDGTNWPPASTGIYRAPAGSNGPLVADLHPDFSSGATASGCVAAGSALAHDIQQYPSRYYLLLTDATHPDGAVRAQLIK